MKLVVFHARTDCELKIKAILFHDIIRFFSILIGQWDEPLFILGIFLAGK